MVLDRSSAMLVTGVEGLYVWCRRITGGYRGVEVNNMTEAWRSGLAFCAIIHRFRPDLIDYDGLDEGDPVGNCELAFRVAERELGIPALLDPRDMLDCPVIDKLSVLTYLAQFYHKFSGTAPQPTTRNSRVPSTNPSLSPRVSVSSPRLSVPTESTSPPRVEAASSDSSSSSSSSDVSTDSGLDQSASEMSSPCSRVSSVSPVSASPETPRVSPPEPPVGFRGILKSRENNSSKLGKKKEYSRSFESLLDIPSPAPKRSDSNSELRNDQAAESSFKAAFKKFSTLSCSSSSIKASPCSPPKPARSHLVVGRSASSSLLRTVECQTEERVPVLVSQVTQTEESHLEQGEERRRGRSHRRQTSTTVPRAHIVNAHQQTRGVPNCDRNRQSRLLNGIASYGQLDRLLGRSMENIYSASPHPPSTLRQNRVPQFARTHSTLV